MRGALIVLEGVDRCGKTTQCAKILEHLTTLGHKAEAMRFPARDTAIGKIIDAYLKNSQELSDEAVHLLFSANRWELNSTIRDKLSKGVTLVVDRYAFSGACFTHAKGLDLEWCQAPDRGLPEPDLVLFLDLDVEQSKKRGAFGLERYEKTEFQRKVRKCFLEMASDTRASYWQVVDADQTIEKVTEVLLDKVIPIIKSASEKPIGDLYLAASKMKSSED